MTNQIHAAQQEREQHTPEPWFYPNDRGARRITNMETVIAWQVECGFTEADARRIVACVNACVGIPVLALESMNEVTLNFKKMAYLYDRAMRQREELLAALDGAANYIDRLGGDSGGYRITISSVKGGA